MPMSVRIAWNVFATACVATMLLAACGGLVQGDGDQAKKSSRP